MSEILALLASSLARPIRQKVTTVARGLLLMLAAGLLLIVAFGFLVAALFIGLASIYGPGVTALVLGICLAVAALLILAAAAWKGRLQAAHPGGRRAHLADLGSGPSPERADAVVKLLNDASLAAALEAGRRLKPYELVGLALFAGFITGRRP